MDYSTVFEFIPLGAIIRAFHVGKTNIVQGFPTEALYQTYNHPHFGETIGRVANRVANAQLTSLNQKHYDLTKNDGANSIHGGAMGWGKRIWEGPTPVGIREIAGLIEPLRGGECVVFKLRSDHGDEGYPGNVEAKVFYTAGKQFIAGKEIIVLGIEYEVRLLENDNSEVEETVVNMTNHSYFNLGNSPTIDGTEVTLCSNKHLILGKDGIPTTTNLATHATIIENDPFTLVEKGTDFDHCFIVDPSNRGQVSLDTRSSPLRRLVTAYHPHTKIKLEVLSTEPAFQFYTGQHINVPEVEGAPARGPRSGFCVEPSRYINAVNQEEWKNQVVLKKGQVYGCRTVYRGCIDNQEL